MSDFITNWKKTIDAGLFPYVSKDIINAINDYLDYNKSVSDGLNTRIVNLENNETIYQLYEYVGKSTTGQIQIPTGATIFDLYGDGLLDAIMVVASEDNTPTEENSINSGGQMVQVTSLDNDGNYVLDSIPTFNACILYYIKIKDVNKGNVNEDKIVSSFHPEQLHSVGVIDINVPNFTNNGNGTITVEPSNIALRSDINHVSLIKSYLIPEATLTPTGEECYLYADFNNGDPVYKITTNATILNGSDTSLIYVLWPVSNSIIHSANQDSIGLGLPNKINKRILNTTPYEISSAGGLTVVETTTPTNRTITCTSAIVYKGVAEENVLSFNSSTDTLTKVIKLSNGTWTYTPVSVYDNTGYNPDGLGEVALGVSKFGYRLYYRSIGDDKEIFYVQSKAQYNSVDDARAAASIGRDIPTVLARHCLLVGRSIIEQAATNGITEPFVQQKGYFSSPIPNHNETGQKQGGQDGQYYHLTYLDYQNKILGQAFGDVLNSNYSQFESTGFLKKVGEAQEWVDIDFPIIIRTTGTGIPTLTTLQGNITVPQWSVNDFNVCEGQEFIHGWAEGTEVFWHVHVITNGLDATDRYLKWEVEYTWANVNGQLSVNTVESNEVLIPADTPDRTMLIMSISSFVPTGGKIGGHTFARLRRIASTGTAPTNDPFCSMLQLHILCDTTGSRNIGTK